MTANLALSTSLGSIVGATHIENAVAKADIRRPQFVSGFDPGAGGQLSTLQGNAELLGCFDIDDHLGVHSLPPSIMELLRPAVPSLRSIRLRT